MQPKEKLTNAEFELMESIWQTPEPICSTSIMEHLDNGKDWKVTTVLTLLGKLVEKGYIQGEKQGRAYYYQILVSREEYLQAETSHFLDRLYQGSLKNMVAMLYENQGLSQKDIDELVQWFQEEV